MNAPLPLASKIESASPFASLEQLIQAAAKVIAPTWPLATFAARSPWLNLEEQSFSEVARQMQEHGITMFPSHAANLAQLEPDSEYLALLDAEIKHWLSDWQSQFTLQTEACEASADVWQFTRQSLLQQSLGIQAAEQNAWLTVATQIADNMADYLLPSEPARKSAPLAFHSAEEKQQLDAICIRWCKLFLGRHQAAWALQSDSLFAAWREQIEYDPDLSRSAKAILKNCPQTAISALDHSLNARIPVWQRLPYLQSQLLALPGWAGILLWQGRQHGNEWGLLTEYLALRVCLAQAMFSASLAHIENRLSPKVSSATPLTSVLHTKLVNWAQYTAMKAQDWQALSLVQQKQRLHLLEHWDTLQQQEILLIAREKHYRQHLQALLTPAIATPVAPAAAAKTAMQSATQSAMQATAAVQCVFCIDVRSEPMRRAIESAGPQAGSIVTYACAGFFGMAIRTSTLDTPQHTHDACPVILKPRVAIREMADMHSPSALRYRRQQQHQHYLQQLQKHLKQDPLASLSLPEISGAWQAFHMLWQSLAPTAWRRRLAAWRSAQKPQTYLHYQALNEATSNANLASHLSQQEQVEWAAQALRTIGLTANFAPLVAIIGHASHSRNNPYAAKLDCGACGGASGAFNARLLVALCNDAQVRCGLRLNGIHIPDECQFVAYEHLTSRDQLRCLEGAPTSAAARASWQMLQAALPAISAQVSFQRMAQLPGSSASKAQAANDEAWRRSDDWSEVRPEWGLAGNAALIIGKREFSQGKDLQGRAFLHSYDSAQDADGSLLANIIAGPATVAQWINLQYYASTVAPHFYGSGSKTTQSITAGIGVMQGNASDLLAGLPWQAVMQDDATPFHQAQRLLIIIQAEHEKIAHLLATQHAFAQKVRHHWLYLSSFDPHSKTWRNW